MNDFFLYKDKTCVITGAATGIGKSAAEMLVNLGAEVYALDYAEVKAPGVKQFIPVDLGKRESIDQAFQKVPDQIDAFFGVAGVSGQKHDFINTFNIDFTANKYLTETYLEKRMKTGGSITYVTSVGGLGWEVAENQKEFMMAIEAQSWDEIVAAIQIYKDVPGAAAYDLAKRAMNYYVATIVERYGMRKIRVNALLPAATDTPLTDEFAISTGGRENLEKYTGTAQRFAQPQEMAGPLVFLGSNMASYISGLMLIVDHGLSLPMLAGISPYLMGLPVMK